MMYQKQSWIVVDCFILLYKSLYTVEVMVFHDSDASKNDMAPYLLHSGRPTNADLTKIATVLV